MTPLLWTVVGVFAVANIGALIFAFLRFRATRDLPPTLPETIQAPLDADGITPAARFRELESKLQSIERAFNDLHSTVETRHRSLTGGIAQKMGRSAAPVVEDEGDEPQQLPQSAFEKLAQLEAQQRPPQPPAPNSTGRRHLRRY